MYGDRFCGELNPPSIHPNLPLCNCSAKHGTIQGHRLGEVPSTVEPQVFGRKCRFDEAFLVIPIVDRSGCHLEGQKTLPLYQIDWTTYQPTKKERKNTMTSPCV